MTFQQKYFKIVGCVQEEIECVLKEMINGIEIQEPLKSKLFALLNAPSKHIRPLISFLYLKAIGKTIDKNQILYQSAIELVHNASLIHDDIIDESLERRKVKTLNCQLGNKLAVLTGDYLLSQALNKVLQIGEPELVQMFSKTLEVMCKGEINQQFSRYRVPSVEEYIKKSQQKTAKLFETSLEGSLLITKLNSNGSKFAKYFGTAFQIRDDLINCKTSKSDIDEGIYTAPVILSGDINNIGVGIEKTQVLLNNYITYAENELKFIENNKYKRALIKLLGLMKHE